MSVIAWMRDALVLLFDAGACEGAAGFTVGPASAPWATFFVAQGVTVGGWHTPGYLFFAYLALFIVGTGFGVVVGYHRMLTHRSVVFSKWLERTLVLAGIYAGTPVQWVGNHRYHHGYADTPKDPHSPSQKGFWVAHAGWYLSTSRVLPAVVYTFAGPFRTIFDAFWRPRTNQEHAHLANDVARDRFYAALSRPATYAAVLLGSMAFHLLLVTALWGAGAALVFALLTVVFYALGDGINSLGHSNRRFALGTAPWNSGDESRNSHVLAALSFGDGYHNGHHAFPFSARAGLLPGEVDAAWLFIRACERLGLATEVKVPSREQLEAKANRPPMPMATEAA